MAERDLAVVPGEDVQAEQRDEVDPDERELPEPELAGEPRKEHDQRDRPGEHATLQAGASRATHQTLLTTTRPKSPAGRTSEHEQQDGERGRQLQLLADEVDVAAEQVDHDAER